MKRKIIIYYKNVIWLGYFEWRINIRGYLMPKPSLQKNSSGCVWRCPWRNGYRRRKWTRCHEFKSWTRLIAFHIALIPLGKVWIQLFSLQLWVNRHTRFFSLGEATRRKKNSEFKPVKLRLKFDLVSYPARAEGLVNMVEVVFNTSLGEIRGFIPFSRVLVLN